MADAEAEEEGNQSFYIFNTVNATKVFWCLRPCAGTVNEVATFPPLTEAEQPYLGRYMRSALAVDFEGWTKPPRRWHVWVKKLQAMHATTTWTQAHIQDAILSSKYQIPCNQDLVLQLVNNWSPSSNTFIFDWGEATVTLEDVWVLGGYSVLGEPVSQPLTPEAQEMVDRMLDFQIEISERGPRRTDEQTKWINFFLKQKTGHELEHIAFLSLWLSRFVFPFKDPDTDINRDLFGIAVHLSEGKRLALAPAVLAGVYHFLSLLKEKAFSWVTYTTITIDERIAGAFELVHHWAYERFPTLAPSPNEILEEGEPRAQKWHGRGLVRDVVYIKYSLNHGPEIIDWRPYIDPVVDWEPHYGDYDREVFGGFGSDKDLSFGMCLCACELEGVADVPPQKYMPHRVALQFGIDQHLPGEFAVMKPKRIDMLRFIVPSIGARPVASLEYLNWWEQSKMLHIMRFMDAM